MPKVKPEANFKKGKKDFKKIIKKSGKKIEKSEHPALTARKKANL